MTRMVRRIKRAIETYQKEKVLSKPMALYYAASVLTNKYLEKHRFTMNIKHTILRHEVYKSIPKTLKKYRGLPYYDGEKPQTIEPIWMCWLDDFDSMNDLVKRCAKSLFDNAGDHSVIYLNNKNIENYITIPEHIKRKRNQGQIGNPHYCDIVRMLLLKQYGGLWVDADLFVSKSIHDNFFSKPFITEKNNHEDIPYLESIKYVGRGSYTMQVIGGWKNNTIISFISDAIIEYWENNNAPIDWLFFDYIFEIIKRKINGAKIALEEGAINNGHYRKLNQAMKNALPADLYNDCVVEDTTFNTLNWRSEYPLKTSSDTESVYAEFLKNQPIDKEILYSNYPLYDNIADINR